MFVGETTTRQPPAMWCLQTRSASRHRRLKPKGLRKVNKEEGRLGGRYIHFFRKDLLKSFSRGTFQRLLNAVVILPQPDQKSSSQNHEDRVPRVEIVRLTCAKRDRLQGFLVLPLQLVLTNHFVRLLDKFE